MRLDKYLKISRLIKRRTLAKEASEGERVLVNGLVAKPSKEVKVGDLVTISFGKKELTVKITSLIDSTKKADASLMYELVSESNKE
jgi:ribosomal 50S subunit-recycling heat shock protein